MQTEEKKVSMWPRIVLFFGMLALICAAALLVRRMQAKEPEPTEEPEMTPVVEQGPALPENAYDLTAFSMQDGRMVYAGEEPVYAGIDVSMHQGEIDWQAVADSGIDFAIIRVGNRGSTEGRISLDEYFLDNMEGAIAAGLKVGVYFFSQAISEEEAREEARFVLNWIGGYDLAYPVYFDWEPVAWEARTDGMDPLTLTACAKAFCSEIAAAGYRAGLYFNQSYGYQEFDLTELQEYTFWLASYSDTPNFQYHFDVWQYSATGSVPGVATDVDLNLSFTTFIEQE